MSSMINTVNPIDIIKNSYNNAWEDPAQFVLDPGDIFSTGKSSDEATEKEAKNKAAATLLSEQESAQDDVKNAARTSAAKKKSAAGASTVLTSPLGGSSSVSTAITKLGGS